MKKIYAFWSMAKLISIELIILLLFILTVDDFAHLKILNMILIGLVITIPLLFSLCGNVEIKNDTVEFNYMTFQRSDNIDNRWNWKIYKNEIIDVEIVKLTSEEKKLLTSSRFLFNKYLKVTLLTAKCKYIYVSAFNNFQIKKII